jgi:hypothetical protein
MWFWAAIAVAEPIALEEAQALGPPLTHDIDTTAGVMRLEWRDDSGEPLVHEVALASIRDVRRVADVGGPHLLLLTTDEGTIVLERGPCVLLAAMAPRLAAQVDRPLIDGPACEDPNADAIDWLERRARESTFTHVEAWNEAVIADVRVTERRTGEPALDVQRGLVGARPMLGHCFSRQQVSGRASFDATARPDGSLGRVSPVSPGTGTLLVDGCIEEQLGEAALQQPPDRKRKVQIEVSAP